MKAISFCFMLIYFSVFGYYAIAQVIDKDTNLTNREAEKIMFTKFEIVRQNGKLNFDWNVSNQAGCRYFEIEMSSNEKDFKVIALAFPFENYQDSVYKYYERISKKANNEKAFFRIKALMENISPVYSNVISLTGK